MLSITGTFASLSDAAQAIARLRAIGIADNAINLLAPGPPECEAQELAAVPLSETEQPGMGKGLGGVIGAALGLAGGMSVGTAVASLFLPGVGPVIAVGLAAAGILGGGGAIGGAAVGDALESADTRGLPEDELFFYEDALRSGHSVVIAFAAGKEQAERIREVLRAAGAESLDAAREKWWIGLRDAEKVHYEETGQPGRDHEFLFRCGFEAALRPGLRAKSYQEALTILRTTDPERCARPLFLRGFERGRQFDRERAARPGQHRAA